MQAEVPHAQAVQEPPQPLQPWDAAAGVTPGQHGHSESLSPGFCCQTRAERFIPGAKSGMRKQKITWGRWLRNRQALLFFFFMAQPVSRVIRKNPLTVIHPARKIGCFTDY